MRNIYVYIAHGSFDPDTSTVIYYVNDVRVKVARVANWRADRIVKTLFDRFENAYSTYANGMQTIAIFN
jgi:hypothetical protein